MKILCLDTSGKTLSVAICDDGDLVSEFYVCTGLKHSEDLLPIIDSSLKTNRLGIGEIDCFAAVYGPGSFTGIRIGVETVKALAHATGKPCIGIDALEAAAHAALPWPGLIFPLQDARAGQVYCALFRGPQRLSPDRAISLSEAVADLPAAEPVCLAGDGSVSLRKDLESLLGDRCVFLPSSRTAVHASDAAAIAWQRRGEAGDWQTLLPMYLRAPQAERERAAREAKQHG